MDNLVKKDGYGQWIDQIIHLGDLILINLLGILYFNFLAYKGIIPPTSHRENLEFLLVANLCYFVVSFFTRSNVADNIVFIDKVIQNSLLFIIFYDIVLVASTSFLRVFSISLIYWILGFLLVDITFVFWRVLFRLLLKKYRQSGKNYKRVIIIGGNTTARDIFKELAGNEYGYRILGFFDDNETYKDVYEGYLGKVSDIEDFLKDNSVDEIYYALLDDRESSVNNLMTLSEKRMIRFYLVPEYYKYLKRRMSLRLLNTIPLMTMRNEPLQHGINRIVKRVFDIVLSLFVLIFIFPFMYIICGFFIKASSKGPIFFKQKRTGIQGKEFDCYKFRSMRINDTANLKSATKNDPRVTKIGKFMRVTSIDEFPQFINVLKGDMSIVGPRPHMLKHTEQYSALISKFMVRHLVKPGITGWAQVMGWRGETKTVNDMEERVKHDVWYIENWSLFLDIKIIFLTVVNVFRGEENAY